MVSTFLKDIIDSLSYLLMLVSESICVLSARDWKQIKFLENLFTPSISFLLQPQVLKMPETKNSDLIGKNEYPAPFCLY